jgi:SAM-dependent methyltransferase
LQQLSARSGAERIRAGTDSSVGGHVAPQDGGPACWRDDFAPPGHPAARWNAGHFRGPSMIEHRRVVEIAPRGRQRGGNPGRRQEGEMDPLVRLGRALREEGYAFVTPTPETHRRVLSRKGPARTLRDVFGWSQAFLPGRFPRFEALLDEAGELRREEAALRSGVRFSTLGPLLLAHSAYPTTEPDAVFLGPDTYRFAALLESRVQAAGNLADVGCGSGAGGLLLAPRARSVQLLDLSPRAVRFAQANAELNGLSVRCAVSDVLSAAEGPLDLVVANPPYLADDLGRAYRDGGGGLGTALSVRIAAEALQRLQPGGRLLLYTATPVVDGQHLLWPPLQKLVHGLEFSYGELDPDVFGEELDRPAYRDVERIAVVALDVAKR